MLAGWLVADPIGTNITSNAQAQIPPRFTTFPSLIRAYHRNMMTTTSDFVNFPMQLIPVFGSILAIAFLGERLAPLHIVGYGSGPAPCEAAAIYR